MRSFAHVLELKYFLHSRANFVTPLIWYITGTFYT
jgi:hypothetical protein